MNDSYRKRLDNLAVMLVPTLDEWDAEYVESENMRVLASAKRVAADLRRVLADTSWSDCDGIDWDA